MFMQRWTTRHLTFGRFYLLFYGSACFTIDSTMFKMCTAKGTNDTCKVDVHVCILTQSWWVFQLPRYWPIQLIVKVFEPWRDRDKCSSEYLSRTCSLARNGLENILVIPLRPVTSESEKRPVLSLLKQHTWVTPGIIFFPLTSLHHCESTHTGMAVMDEWKPDRKQIASYCNRAV